MKTVIIYESDNIYFFVVEGDYRHLDRTYLNSMNEDSDYQDELENLIYDSENHCLRNEPVMNFPTVEVACGAAVIVAGEVV